MHPVTQLLRILVPIAYALAEVLYLSLFLRDDPLARRAATPFLLCTVILHGAFILLRGFELHRHPIGSPLEALTIMAFAVAMVHVLIEVTHGNQGAGVFVIGVVFIFQVIASAFMGTHNAAAPLEIYILSPWFGIHTGTAIIGYSGFAVSAAYGLLFLLLYREIKASRFGRIYERLPSLDLLAHMTVRAAAVGFVFLTAAIIAGVIWSLQLDFAFFKDPKFFTTILLWMVYGACLGAHYFLGWHERRFIYFSLFGFLIMIFSMVVVHALFRSFHSFT